MNPDSNTLGGRIDLCAKMVGSVAELVRKTDIPRATLVSYIADSTEPPASRSVAIARAAGVRLEWLIAGEGPMLATEAAEIAQSQSPGLAMEPRLMGLVVETVRRLMNELSMRLPDPELGRMYLELYAEILAKAEDEEDYPALLELAGNRLRREILKEEPGSGKRSA